MTNLRNELFKKPSPIVSSTSAPLFKVDKFNSYIEASSNAVKLSPRQQSGNTPTIIKLISEDGRYGVFYPVSHDERIIDPYTIQLSAPVRSHFGFAFGPSSRIKLLTVSNDDVQPAITLLLNIENVIPANHDATLDARYLIEKINSHFKNYPFCPGQLLILPCEDPEGRYTLVFSVTAVNHVFSLNANDGPSNHLFTLNNQTSIQLTLHNDLNNLQLRDNATRKGLLLDFAAKGVGGHKKQLEQIIRQGFYSRAMPAPFSKAYGVNHTKGILLYGPPGTGKTLIARAISHMFTEDNVKIINGAELKNKFVGESTANLRRIFEDATQEWRLRKENSELHVLIFDELDALAPARGSRASSSSVDDEMVSQLLTLLDGVNSPDNILVIGMTNRKDLIDPALLRSGRIEIHIEIGLPDLTDRLEILQIKTNTLSKSGLLAPDVDLSYWATRTTNYTGADLQQLVRCAATHAMGNNFITCPESNSLRMNTNITDASSLAKLTHDHFVQAFKEVTPFFGVDCALLNNKIELFIPYDDHEKEIIAKFTHLMDLQSKQSILKSFNFLIVGEAGTGKTQLALALASLADAKHIKLVTADKLLSLSLDRQIQYLDDVFENARRAENSIIVMDDLENILGANADQRGYSNPLRLKLSSLLSELEQSKKSIIIIATATRLDFLKQTKLLYHFNEQSELLPITLHANNIEDILHPLCIQLNYSGTIDMNHIDTSEINISLPIRELSYQLKKLIAQNEGKNSLNISDFIQSLVSNYDDNPREQSLRIGKRF